MCVFLFNASLINVTNAVTYGGEVGHSHTGGSVCYGSGNKTESDSDLSQHIHTLYLVYRTIRLIGLINL